MNELRSFFKKNHWLIIPALLATFCVGFGFLLVQPWLEFEPNIIILSLYVLGVFCVLLERNGFGTLGSMFLVWTTTFCFFVVIYYMGWLLYRFFAPVKVGKG